MYSSRVQEEKFRQMCTALAAFNLDNPDAKLTFSQRLAREQYDWTHEFALRVVEEYKRFVILMVVCEHRVTPSDAVDQAWHLHLVYTHSYQEMCNRLGGGFLHHGPTKGGPQEHNRFNEQYQYTLAEYRRLFREEPPGDIWPEAEIRFAPKQLGVWVRGNDCVVVKRSTVEKISVVLIITAFFIFGAIAMLSLPNLQLQEAPTNISTITVITAIVIMIFLLLLLLALHGKKCRSQRAGYSGSSFFEDISSGISDIFSGCGDGCGSGCGGCGD